MAKSRKNIGLMVSNPANNFDGAVLRGAMTGANERDVNLIVFPGRYIKGDFADLARNGNMYQYNSLFSYADSANLDALIILMGTVGTTLNEVERKAFLDMYRDIPVVILAGDAEDYVSVNFDNKVGLVQGISMLIEERKCTKIGFVSGPITNEDAVERYEAYRETLENHNIEYDEKRVAYGNFSQYSMDVVENLINNNPDLEAIVFANDSMAIGGYKVLKKHNIVIGKDIYVMGFDDSPASMQLEPHLSSVCADAEELGCRGVNVALDYLEDKIIKKKFIKTAFVERESTGEFENDIIDRLQKCKIEEYLKIDMRKASEIIFNQILGINSISFEKNEFQEGMISVIECYFTQLKRANELQEETPFNSELVKEAFSKEGASRIGFEFVHRGFGIIKTIAYIYFSNVANYANILACDYLVDISRNITTHDKNVISNNVELLDLISFIARDMLYSEDDDDTRYLIATQKIKEIGYTNFLLYSFDEVFVNLDTKMYCGWEVPEKLRLKSAIKDGGKVLRIDENRQLIDYKYIFKNEFVSEKRHTFIVDILFVNEEQMGVVVYDVDFLRLKYYHSITEQLSSAFKIISMMKKQNGIQKQLEASLQKTKISNRALEVISKTDELTGIYNRRGFFDKSYQVLRKQKNKNVTAAVVFVDMNNLKKVNDCFGHSEGDYSLRSIADILKASFSAADIIARIGGDEFAVLAIENNGRGGEQFKSEIKRNMEEFNDECEKPYYIEASVGYSEFKVSRTVDLEEILSLADEKLYEDKSQKRQDIIKTCDMECK